MMQIEVTGLTAFASTTDGASFATSSILPPANTLILAAVLNTKASSADAVSSLTGCGLTWTEHTSIRWGSGNPIRLTVFSARGSAPSSGALTAAFGGATQTGCHIQVVAVGQAFPWVSVLTETVLQSKSGSVIGADTLTLTFSDPFEVRSGAIAFFGALSGSALAPGSGWTELYEQSLATPSSELQTQWRKDNTTAASVSAGVGIDIGGIAFEILAATQPVGAPEWPLSLHLYETPSGNLIYTFPDPVGLNPSDNEKGFEALSGFQRMQPWEAFWLYGLAPAKWLVLSYGGFSVWEGRLEDRKLEPEWFRFTAFGARRALDDAPYTALWSSKSYAGIKPVSAEEIAKAAPERWAMDNNNRVWFGLVNGETYNNDDHYGLLVFRSPHRGEQKIKQITYNYDYTLPTNWKLEIMGYDEGFASGAVEQTYTGDGANHTATGITLTLATPKDFVVFRVRNATGGNVTFAGATGSSYAKVTNLRVKGTTSTDVYADEIAKGLVAFISTLNPGQFSSSYAGIQSPGLDLEDVLFEDMTPAAILDDLVSKGDKQTPPRKWEWAVWENQLLYFRPQGDGALTWYVDVDELLLDSTLETLVNQAYALYQDANNRTQRTTVATDAESYAQYGLYRRGVAQAGQTTSSTKADAARDTLLNDQAVISPRAQLTLYGLFDATGARYPLWMLRSGDTVVVRNLPPTLGSEIDRIRTFRVTRKVYDVDNDVLTPTPEFALPNVEIQIASTLRPRTGNVPGVKPGAQLEPPIFSPPVFA